MFFFGSEILANNDFFGSMKDAGIFLGCKKRIRGVFLSCEKRTKGFFGGMLKKIVIFWGRQIFLGIKYDPLSNPPPPPHH